MNRLIVLFLFLTIGANAQNRFFLKGKTVSTSTGSEEIFSSVSTSQTGKIISVTFDVDRAEEPAKPTVERVTVIGTEIDGGTLTASYSGYYSASQYADASTWTWYRADNAQSTGSVIPGATSSTYNPIQADVAKVLRPVLTPTDEIGTVGEPVTAVYTGQIQDDEFNPFTDISWHTALQPSGAVDLATNLYWRNDGAGTNSTQNGSDPIPTYVSGAVDFEASNNEELILDQPSTQFSMPVEIWIRFKKESNNASFSYPLAWTSAQRIEQRAGGAIYLSGGNCSYTAANGTWIVARFLISGVSNTSEFNVNNGTELTNIAASTAAFGTSNGRIGSNQGGTGNRYDGLISHIFVKSGQLSAPDQAAMWTWFQTYFDWD